jgi:uncharacterized protein
MTPRPGSTAEDHAPPEGARDLRVLAAGASLSALWLGAFSLGVRAEAPLFSLGAIAAVVVLACALVPALRPRLLPASGAATTRAVVVGLAFGAASLAGTYLAWPLVRALAPGVAADVGAFYGYLQAGPATVPLVCLVLVAEELLWRGALLDAARGRTRASGGAALAVVATSLLYAAGQLGSGLPILAGVAMLLGCFWAVERIVTGSLLAPLISHAMWTLTVLVLRPLEP